MSDIITSAVDVAVYKDQRSPNGYKSIVIDTNHILGSTACGAACRTTLSVSKAASKCDTNSDQRFFTIVADSIR
jgi:hypothetical protein